MNTAAITSGHTTAIRTLCCAAHEVPAWPGSPNSSRHAVTVADMGFHSAMAPSQPGIVLGAISALDRNPIGHTRICTAATDPGPLALRPRYMPVHTSE